MPDAGGVTFATEQNIRIRLRAIAPAAKNVLCGAVIGASMLIPGVSGGTTAIMIGIYDRLVRAVSQLWGQFRQNIIFLAEAALGGLIGMVLFSGAVLRITRSYPMESAYLFMGAILGSVPLMVRKAELTKRRLGCVLFAGVGILLSLAIGQMSAAGFSFADSGIIGGIKLVLCGVVIAAALILPGISTSHVLLMLGLYETVLGAISALDIPCLALLGAGTAVGVLLLTRILDRAMTRYPSPTYMMIAGFVLASVYDLFPGTAQGGQMLLCVLLFAAGFTVTANTMFHVE